MAGQTAAETGLAFTDAAKMLCSSQAKGRALVLEFRELSPGGCCSAGAVTRLQWTSLSDIPSDSDLISWGDVNGVPVYIHHVFAAFLKENQAQIVVKRFGPFKWLAINSDKDPAMWCFFGDGPFSSKKE